MQGPSGCGASGTFLMSSFSSPRHGFVTLAESRRLSQESLKYCNSPSASERRMAAEKLVLGPLWPAAFVKRG